MTIHLQLLSFPWSTTVFREDLVRTKIVKNMSSLRSITTFPPWRSFQVPRHWLFFHCCHSNPIVYESLVPDFFSHRLASYNQAIGYQALLFFRLLVNLFVYLFIWWFFICLFVYLFPCSFIYLFIHLLTCVLDCPAVQNTIQVENRSSLISVHEDNNIYSVQVVIGGLWGYWNNKYFCNAIIIG